MRVLVRALVGTASLLLAVDSTFATTFTVTNLNDSGPGSLRDTIAAANSGDTIDFAVTGTIALSSPEILIDKSLTINGPAIGITIQQQSFFNRIFRISNGSSNGPTVYLSNLIIADGSAPRPIPIYEDGGGLYNDRAKLTMQSCTVRNCFATNTGGVFSRPSGGGVMSFGQTAELTVLNCFFTENLATLSGGAVENRGGKLTVIGSHFHDNTSERGGGAHVSSSGEVASLIAQSTFVEAHGTAIGNAGQLQVLNCTFVANAPFGVGAGGIVNSGALLVRHCTFHNNFGSSSGTIRNFGAGQVTVGNTIFQSAGTWSLVNDSGTTVSEGYNLADYDPAGLLTGPHDQVNADAKLDPLGLQNNGGPTPTIALLANSPALDRGNSFGVFADQRGSQRPVDSPLATNASDGADIGAYEATDALQTGVPSFNVTTLHDHDDGIAGTLDCTLREAINRANAISGANTILFLVGGTITLDATLGPLTVTGPTTLAGFGARVMTISGGNSTPVFHVSDGPSFFSGLTIRDGRSSAFFPTPVGGAGLFNTGTLTVNVCAFVNNQAVSGAGGNPGEAGGLAQGGGVLNGAGGVLTFNRCTFSGNTATGGRGANSFSDFNPGGMGGAAQGGALFNDSGATLTLSLCTLAGNSATGGAGGNNTGGIGFGGNGGAGEGAAVFNRGTLNVRASTVARNMGLGGAGGLGSVPVRNGSNGSGSGGVTHHSGTATLRNSIAALNTGISGPDVAGAFTSEGYNFIGIGDTAIGFTGPADQVGTAGAPFDPGLGALQNNGGPTDTLGLLADGPAIDAGHSFGLTSDQRGQPRPSDHPLTPNAPGGDGADIGAFESRAVFFVTTLDDHDDGSADEFDCSLREAINAANADAGDQAIKFAPLLTGTIQLNSALPSLSTPIFLQGPGANVLTVRRNAGGDYRIFTISNGTSDGPFVSIRGLTIANGAGGIFVDRGVLDLQHCALTGNHAGGHGGGVFITERSTSEPSLIQNCTFSGNSTIGGLGGGLCITSAAAKVANCTFSGNSSNFFGGAMFAGLAGPSGALPELAVESCTLSANNATNGGGGISKADIGRVLVTNNIFNNNGGGSLHTFGQAPESQGYNLSSDAGGGYLTATGDIVNTNPLLGPLASNGGPTQTHALLPGSPAINMGFPDLGPPGDQRGYPRIARQDIGAFEFDSFALRIISISRLPNGHVLLEGKGIVNTFFTILASPELSPASFNGIGTAPSDSTGLWQYEDPDAVGLTERFYKASFP